jgi:hypothetical protein
MLCWYPCCLQRKLESAVSDVQRQNDKLKEKVAQLSNKVRQQQQSSSSSSHINVYGVHAALQRTDFGSAQLLNYGCRKHLCSCTCGRLSH